MIYQIILGTIKKYCKKLFFVDDLDPPLRAVF